MAYTDIDKPSDYMRIQTWSGNNSADREITWSETDNMQPDWIWVKRRSDTANHRLADSVRGATKILRSDTNGAETTESDDTLSFDTNGFSVGSNSGVNKTGDTYVGWGWKAGTSFTNDASSTGIGSIDSSGSVSDASGFSIVSYTGTGSAGTIKHGLSAAPNFMIVKNRDAARSWNVYFGDSTDYMYLNDTAAAADYNEIWNDTTPTTSVFSVGTDNGVNQSGEKYIAYIFADVKGYSKVGGSYTGNDNANGTFVYTGFAPAWVMIKRTNSVNDWIILDRKRNPINPSNERILANSSNASSTANTMVDFLSNGFKPRSTYGGINGASDNFIYMAFAEHPFVSSTGTPTTAR